MVTAARCDSCSGWRMLLAGCWLGLCLAGAGRLHAAPEDADTQGGEPPAAPSAAEQPGEQRPTVDPEFKKKNLSQAFVMLGGIIVGGTLLLLVVVMWGNRTRRFARSPLPNVAKRDELWFLKPKPAAGVDPPHDTTPEEDVAE